MLDLKLIRRDTDRVRSALARRGAAGAIDELLGLDRRRRELLPRLESLRARQNEASEAIGAARRRGDDAEEEIAAMRQVATRVRDIQSEVATVEERIRETLAAVPNVPEDAAPAEDVVLGEWGEAGRTGRDHLELLGALVDMDTGARVSGSRFAYLKGPVAMLELALVRWAMEELSERGFVPVIPPVLVREEAMFGTGFLPDTEQQIYTVPDDDLYLVGTSEVPLASLHAEEIVDAKRLPLRYAGFSSCFRREAGAAGRDTRGIFRVHQFEKVEMFAFVPPEESAGEHTRLLEIEKHLLRELQIPHRVVDIAASDLGASAARKFDLEAWLPGQDRFRELTSCSNTTDYQARRLGARYRPEGGRGPTHLHTLNGTAVAAGRTIIALVENHQRDDGTIAVPEVLHRFGAPHVIEAQL